MAIGGCGNTCYVVTNNEPTENLMRLLSIPLSVLITLAVGCAGGPPATSSYDAKKNVTTYEAGSYTVSTRSGANLGSSKSVTLRAVGRCTGQDCSPNVIRLVFTASGNQDLSLSGLDGEIIADDSRIQWSSNEAGVRSTGMTADNQMIEVSGKFAVVGLPLNKVKQIATAASVNGSIGGLSLDLGSGVQSGLKALLSKIPATASQANATQTSG